MTAEEIEPEKWALELWHAADDAAAECARDEAGYPNYAAALTIQRAFEERERKLRLRLEDALLFVPDNYSFTRQDAPVTENSHDQ